jgi:hypothetical protein
MKQKNTTTKKKKFNENYKKKILDNDNVYEFKDDVEDEILDDHYDSRDDTDVELEIQDDDVDLVAEAIEVVDIVVQKEVVDIVVQEEVVVEEIIIKKGKRIADKTKFYVEPKKFDEEIMKYYDSGKMSNELAEMVSKISHKLSYAPNFINYSYREEMVGDGVIRMMKALIAKKYNREKGTNPFSYFTRIAFNAFRNRIKKEKHIHETHEKYQKELMFMSEQFSNMSKNNNIRIMKERNREY